jgi:type IV pilus assembly protein PilW
MIAMVLGAVLTAGVIQVFTSNSQAYRVGEANARVQEAGRIAADILSRSLRSSGYFGCTQSSDMTNNLDDTSTNFDADQHDIQVAGVSLPVVAPANSIPAADMIRVSGARSEGVSIRSIASVNSATREVDNQGGLQIGDHVVISDCANADVFEISSIDTSGTNPEIEADADPGTPGNDFTGNSPSGCTAVNCLSANYQVRAQILRVYSEVYYLDNNPNGNPALYVQLSDGSRVELVENIADMRIRYRDATGTFPTTAQVEASGFNFNSIVAVEVSLLARSGGNANITPELQQYCFPGWTDCVGAADFTTSPDNRLYRVYNLAVALRNR